MIKTMSEIEKNLSVVRKRIEAACAGSSRDPSGVKLVAVTKNVTTDQIAEAFKFGQLVFGENYAQELRDKYKELSDLPIEWHFIGHLQKNKVKYVSPVAALVETVDSTDLADVISARAVGTIDCLIEVNISGEASKSGCSETEVAKIAAHIEKLPNLNMRGLMTMPPYSDNPEKSRPYFKKLKTLLDKLNDELFPAEPYRELSIGMSHDMEVAIQEGATIVRVGTAIFGERS
ncbi:MAG TPA: YggS family pyridoxal phosphate-dependent enzyme [bacterium]|jgi:hypothetical protein|nr:YggS family pyridoxal phosphate-dependent enzyme [bacterium]HQG13643.1 YggS family pyridoxal phosphate-dependent enzyme [bacterium]HQH80459.1 YggS family pyridoxal phosphate-dependent enzyme [bacterium]